MHDNGESIMVSSEAESSKCNDKEHDEHSMVLPMSHRKQDRYLSASDLELSDDDWDQQASNRQKIATS
jgi:hypothetical protein